MISNTQRRKIKEVTVKFSPKMAGVFGSYARNDHHEGIDILVEFSERYNLLELIRLEQELSDKLDVKVDLVTIQSVNDQIKSSIEKDLIKIS